MYVYGFSGARNVCYTYLSTFANSNCNRNQIATAGIDVVHNHFHLKCGFPWVCLIAKIYQCVLWLLYDVPLVLEALTFNCHILFSAVYNNNTHSRQQIDRQWKRSPSSFCCTDNNFIRQWYPLDRNEIAQIYRASSWDARTHMFISAKSIILKFRHKNQ